MALRIAVFTSLLVLLTFAAPVVLASVGAQQPQPAHTPTPFPTIPGAILTTPVVPLDAGTPTPEAGATPQGTPGDPGQAPAEAEGTADRTASETATPPASEDPAPETTVLLGQENAGPVDYTVRAGDTLYSISRRYGVSVAEIQQENGLPDSAIRSGQVLTIPVPGQVSTPTPSATPAASPTIASTPTAFPAAAQTSSSGSSGANEAPMTPAGESSGFVAALEEHTAGFLSILQPLMMGAPPFILVGSLVGVINTCLYYFFLGRGFKLFIPHLVLGAGAAVLGVIVGKQIPETGPALGEVDLIAASLATWLVLFVARSLRL